MRTKKQSKPTGKDRARGAHAEERVRKSNAVKTTILGLLLCVLPLLLLGYCVESHKRHKSEEKAQRFIWLYRCRIGNTR